jgi:hypothetical protein
MQLFYCKNIIAYIIKNHQEEKKLIDDNEKGKGKKEKKTRPKYILIRFFLFR